MRIVNQGKVFKGVKGTDYQSAAFPGICVSSNDRWICSFRTAPKKLSISGQRILIVFSDDNGKSWSEAFVPFETPEINDRQGSFWVLYASPMEENNLIAVVNWVDSSNPGIPYYNEKTGGILDSRIFISYSKDNGCSWSKPVMMDVYPFDTPVAPTGPILKLPEGELACHFEVHKDYDDLFKTRFKGVVKFSGNGGKTWPEYSITSYDPENKIFCWDQRPSVLSDGTVFNLFWTYDDERSIYLNIHTSESHDNGRTWSGIKDTGVPGQPAEAISLLDGRLAMVYVDRTNEPSIKIRVSEDAGKTWPQKTEFTIYKPEISKQVFDKKSMGDMWNEMFKFSLGLPRTALLDNGDILVVFYAGEHEDNTDVLWARINANS